MPYVNVKMYPGRTEEQKRALTERIVAAVCETCGVEDPSHTAVVIEEIEREDWQAVSVADIESKKHLQYHP